MRIHLHDGCTVLEIADSHAAPGAPGLAVMCGKTSSKVSVICADPQIIIDADVLDMIRSGSFAWGRASLDGDMIKIRGDDQTVIYRVGGRLPHRDAYDARWPD